MPSVRLRTGASISSILDNVTESKNPEYPGKELESMSFAVNYHKWIVNELEPFLGYSAVEVGAGRGDLSAILLETGLKKLFLFEPSSNMFPVLKARVEGRSRIKAINEFFSPDLVTDTIDSILYVNVLEHIEDDRAELLNAYRALPAGGCLLLFVPALPQLYSEVDRSMGHFRRYYKKELIERVKGAGFEVEKARYFDLAGIIPWYVNFVLLKNSFSARSVTLYDRVVVPPMRLFEKLLVPPIGKNVLLVARKT
jgi:SAM-dependent methyltransferase